MHWYQQLGFGFFFAFLAWAILDARERLENKLRELEAKLDHIDSRTDDIREKVDALYDKFIRQPQLKRIQRSYPGFKG